jgi:uncharacterized protein YciI
MFIILINYKKPIAEIDLHVPAHRAFIGDCHKQNFFLAAGPRSPRTGGVLISPLKDRKQLEEILAQDPYRIHDVADYDIIEFNPVHYHQNLAQFIN